MFLLRQLSLFTMLRVFDLRRTLSHETMYQSGTVVEPYYNINHQLLWRYMLVAKRRLEVKTSEARNMMHENRAKSISKPFLSSWLPSTTLYSENYKSAWPIKKK